MAKILTLSVHQLVDYLLRKGDIDNRVFSYSTMQEGSLIHALYQSHQKKNYISEYPLKDTIVIDDVEVLLEGRADGIIKEDDEHYIIDEIKTTVAELEDFYNENLEWHLGQAQCYAYMFAKEQRLNNIDIRLTYIKQGDTKERLVKEFSFSFIELEQIITSYLEEYLNFFHVLESLRMKRDESISSLDFPFSSYRSGQKELGKYIYGIAKNGGHLFAEAPTGIGKTISTLFPYIKSLPNDELSKIFYLTAKTSGKDSAANAMQILKDKGAFIGSIVVTSKEKICFKETRSCNPDECLYAKGYYSKIKSIINYALLKYRYFDYQTIIEIAKDYNVCPFELELDLSLYLDVIICDYNYLFDPISYMKRYFDEDSSHYLALVDEAHNLVERSRSMYSETISEYDFVLAKKSLRKSSVPKLKTQISKITKLFNEYKKKYDEGFNIIEDIDETTFKIFNRFLEVINDINKNNHKEMSKELTDFYLIVNRFMKLYDLANEAFIFYISNHDNHVKIHLLCRDASKFLKSITHRLKATAFFSATLSPIDYYIDTLGGDKHLEPVMMLPSPFPKENLAIFVAPKVSIKYKNRDATIEQVCEYINAFISQKVGNYFIYLPSYEYLEKLLKVINLPENTISYTQNKDMSEQEKSEFIAHFTNSPKVTTIGFAIIGGAFSEGIDLVSDRLIGAVIVGIGMPKINFESDQISEYYDSLGLKGHDYAYLYPGMNKVMQAVGRVIRDENDRGAVLLIDERYTINEYRSLFKKEWDQYEIVFSPNEVASYLEDFYKND